jgi:L-2-hydroxyglutarate oxidase LhgO
MAKTADILIIGGGVVGLSTGIALLEANPSLRVMIAEKEKTIAKHASGRNSGVLHAGFYYTPNSLKAQFCRDGNFELRKLAKKYAVPVHNVGKIVVARDSAEAVRIDELFNRGIENGVELEIHDQEKLSDFEPLATTIDKFLWSPNTGVSDPASISMALLHEFESKGGRIYFGERLELSNKTSEVVDSSGRYIFKHVINASGAQSDRVARSLGIGNEYAMLPFMGVYRATNHDNLPLRHLVYPVPHPINPFLGVHFTLTIDGKVKIGPTAIPITGREQYGLLEGWSLSDLGQATKAFMSLSINDSHSFSAIIKSEWPKISEKYLVGASSELVPSVANVNSWQKKPPGIRAQLVHLPTGRLEQDFVIKDFQNSTHVLNAVSPGWTCSIPFGRYIATKVLSRI